MRLTLLPVAFFLGLAALFVYGLSSGDPSKLPSALIGRSVPEFQLPPIEGLVRNGKPVAGFSNIDLAQGKVSVVNVWASWCGPCQQEHPLLVELGQTSGAPIFGINQKDSVSGARRFLGRFGNPFVAVGADRNGRTSIDWGVYGVPETFVIDGAGRIVMKHVGPISPKSLRTKVLPAIEKARQASKEK